MNAIQYIHNILSVNNKIPIRCKTVPLTGQQFIDLLPAVELLTDGLIFIGSISHAILTSQCKDVVPILWIDEWGYCYVSGNSEYNFFVKMNNYRLASRTTGVLFDPRRIWCPKLLLSSNPVNNCTIAPAESLNHAQTRDGT